MENNIKQTAALSGVFFLLCGIFFVAKAETQYLSVGGASIAAIALVPVVMYLVLSGEIRQLGGTGMSVAFRAAEEQIPSGTASTIQIDPQRTMSKSNTDLLAEYDGQLPEAMSLKLGSQNYKKESILAYLEAFPLKIVVFIDQDRQTYRGHVTASHMKRLLHFGDFSTAEIEDKSVLQRNCVSKFSIDRKTQTQTALRYMEEQDTEALVVAGDRDRYHGIITQEQLVRPLLLNSIEYEEQNRSAV